MKDGLKILRRYGLFSLLVMSVGTAECQVDNMAPVDRKNLDTLVNIDAVAGKFLVPYGYMMARLPREKLQGTTQMQFFSVAFWMPSGKYIDQDAVMQSARIKGPSGEYAVRIVQIKKIGQSESYDPVLLFTNGVTPTDQFEYKRVGVFVEAISHYIAAVGQDTYFTRYFLPDEANVESIFMACFDPSIVDRPALCTGTVRNDALGLTYSLQIENEHLLDAPAIAKKVFSLLSKWRTR